MGQRREREEWREAQVSTGDADGGEGEGLRPAG